MAGAPVISGAKKACLPNVPYPMLDAQIRPGQDVQVAKVYFRAAQSPYFYAVEMTGTADQFDAIIPAPGPETEQVVYYVEAVASSFESSRTAEYVADVVPNEDCKDRGGAALFSGKPQIVVFSTVEGAPALPNGFLSTGIATTVSAGGVTAAVTAGAGGLGAGAITGRVVAGVLGALLLYELVDDDDDEPPASPVTP